MTSTQVPVVSIPPGEDPVGQEQGEECAMPSTTRRDPAPAGALPDVSSWLPVLQRLVDQVPDLTVSLSDAQHRFVFCRGSWLALRDLTPDQVLGRPVAEVVLPGYADALIAVLDQALDGTGSSAVLELDYARATVATRARWEVRAVPVTAPDGSPLVLWTGRNTARLHAVEKALVQALTTERRAAAQLRELAEIRSDFVATVSHELRTPLTSILGNVEMLLDGDAGGLSPMQALMLATVESEAQRLRRMIEDLLTTARIQDGTLAAPRQVLVDLAAVAHGAAREVSGQFVRRGQTLRRDVTGPAWTSGDPEQLRAVLAELLSNASKVSPDGGAVELTCAPDGGLVLVTVRDCGPGIPDAELPHVFERFYRTAHAGSQALPGTGLGLTLVRHTVGAHGGTVSAASSPSGAVFTVRLPAAPEPLLSLSGTAAGSFP